MLEQGLFFKGKLSILGFVLDTQMEVTHPTRLTVKATFDVMEIAGGLIKLRSADAKSCSGASLNIIVTTSAVRDIYYSIIIPVLPVPVKKIHGLRLLVIIL